MRLRSWLAWCGPLHLLTLGALAYLVCQGELPRPALLGLQPTIYEVQGSRLYFDPLWHEPTLILPLQAATLCGLVVLVVAHAMRLRRARQRAGRLGCAVLARHGAEVVVSLATLEVLLQGVLRIVGPGRACADVQLLASLRSNVLPMRAAGPYVWDLDAPHRPSSGGELVAFGTRARRPGELRVLCLGDSWTVGSGVDEAAAWPARLQALLQAHPKAADRTYTVVNGGRGGAGLMQIYVLLAERGLAFEPDLVIYGGAHWESEHFDYTPFCVRPAAGQVACLFTHLSMVASSVASLRRGGQPITRLASGRDYALRCAALLRSRGIPLVAFEHPGKGYRWSQMAEGFAGAQGVTLLVPDDLKWDKAHHLLEDGRGRHPSQAGHELIATWLATELRKLGY